MYERVDEVLEGLVRRIRMIFSKYRRLAFDELNVVSDVRKLYEELDNASRSAFGDIYEYYYTMEAPGIETQPDGWLDKFLAQPSPVIKYAWTTEALRKRDHLTESLIATKGLVTEYDYAMRYWTRMSGWFAVDVADAALMQSRRDTGVTLVMWKAEDDDRTCVTCWDLDGKIFPLNSVPIKPHPNCRCWTVKVR